MPAFLPHPLNFSLYSLSVELARNRTSVNVFEGLTVIEPLNFFVFVYFHR